jgi:uncharacterized protein with PIN domain
LSRSILFFPPFPVTLTALLPHERIAEDWEEEVRDRFFRAVEEADLEILYTAHPFPEAEEECLRLTARLSHSVIAVTGETPTAYRHRTRNYGKNASR